MVIMDVVALRETLQPQIMYIALVIMRVIKYSIEMVQYLVRILKQPVNIVRIGQKLR